MLVDYHIHTSFSHDANGNFVGYVKKAQKQSLYEIGFSDHFHPEDKYFLKYNNLENYIKKVLEFKKNTNFPVKFGLEVDFIPGFESKIEEIVEMKCFDYIIGSVHFIGNWCFDHPKLISEYKKWDISELYHTYFNLVQRSVSSGFFDVVGHADLIKIFGYKPKRDMTKVFLETVKVFKERNICVEVNTRGLRKPCREIYPNRMFLKLCFDQGIPITLSSDAHSPEEVGSNFDQALKLIKEIGYKKIGTFTKRKLKLIEV
jgi:histidinol-phosphatase (PHP family)